MSTALILMLYSD